MNEAPVENEEIKYRFADKKSMETLNEERDIKYFEEHPESESAKIYRREQEEKRGAEIDDWLGELMGEESNENDK